MIIINIWMKLKRMVNFFELLEKVKIDNRIKLDKLKSDKKIIIGS
jgi:hypothetical protein